MSDDIARLGLEIDTSSAAAARRELDKLTEAGKKTEAAYAGIERAARMGGAGTKGYTAAVGDAYGITTKMSEAQVSAIRQYETLIGKTTLLNEGRGREAAQFLALRKAGTTADTEYGRTVAALSGSLYDLEQQQDKTNKSSSNFANTLTRRFIVGYAVANIRQLISSIVGLNAELARTEALGRLTGFGGQGIQGAQSAAAAKGVGGDAFASAMIAFNQQIPLAKAGVGELGALLRANGIAVSDTKDAFFKVADLVKNAADDTARMSILRQAGLPATIEMARFLGQGAEAIRQTAAESAKLSDQQLRDAAALDDRFKTLWENFKRSAKVAIVSTVSEFDALGDAITRFYLRMNPNLKGAISADKLKGGRQLTQTEANDFYKATGAASAASATAQKTTRDWATEKQIAQERISREQQRIALLGNLASVQDAIRAKELEINAAGLNGVSIRREQVDALKRVAEFQAESSKLARSAQFGIFDEARSATNARLELQTLVDDRTIRTMEQWAAATAVSAKNTRALGEAAAVARSPLEQLTRYALDGQNMLKQLDSTAVSSLGAVENSLVSFANGTRTAKEAFADMANSILSDLARMVIRMQITAPLAQGLSGMLGGLFGGGASATGTAGGTAGILAPIHHSGYGPGDFYSKRYVHPAYFDDAPRYHSGIGPGERAAIIRDDESVLTPGQMKALAPASRTAQAPPVTVTPSFKIEITTKNLPPIKATQQKGSPGGGFDFGVLLEAIDESMAQRQSDGSGQHARVLSSDFGVSRKFG